MTHPSTQPITPRPGYPGNPSRAALIIRAIATACGQAVK
jgi:hypothetical protein